MQEEKHLLALEEVKTLLDESLKDPRGLLARQRILMSGMSLGVQHIVEIWFHRLNAIKPGSIIKHEWFASEERKLKLKMEGVLTKDMENLKDSSRILSLARKVERNRNDIIYGSPLHDDSILREKIEFFLELKKTVEKSTDTKLW